MNALIYIMLVEINVPDIINQFIKLIEIETGPFL